MSYITPSTNVRLLNNCPLESTYNHTLWFDSASAQSAYFIGLTKYNLANYSYQRHTRNTIKVGILADKLYDVNYMMFQNTNFGTKWFYAFVLNVEYVNNNTSLVTYEIDVIQTWLFNFTLGQCFVEREHSETDNIGEHILPEPVELGEYMLENYSKVTTAIDPLAVIIAYSDTGSASTTGNTYDGVYSGVTYRAFNSTDVDSINTFVSSYLQSPDSIVAMYMCPVLLTGQSIPEGGVTIAYSTEGWSYTATLQGVNTGTDDFSGYTPKNNKLYTYPYNYLHVDNASGQSLELRYEFFSGGSPRLKFDGNLSAPVKVSVRPVYYKGINEELNTEVITLENYPQCSWNIDAYKVWLSQNIVPMFMKGITSIAQIASGGAQMAAGISYANPISTIQGASQIAGGTMSLHDQVKQFMMDRYTASIAADPIKGNINNGNLNVSHGYQNIYAGRYHITRDYAESVDNFFTVFGYSCKKVKVPNRNSRPYFNYTKTAGCIINGSVPAEDERKICQIHDNGITYWKGGNNVGNYSLNNSPS